MKAIICRGLPGSGKSTWAKNFCENNPDYIRVNRDDIRNMRGKYWLPKDEDLVTKIHIAIIDQAILAKKNVVIDDTNLNDERYKTLSLFLEAHGYTVEEKHFDLTPEKCIENDLKRPNSVGAKVIWDMYDRYIIDRDPVVYEAGLPDAVIFDIDGTIALNNGRSPYDYSKVGEDLVNEPIKELLLLYKKSGKLIIIFSGRDGVCAEATVDWLSRHEIPFDFLGMRDAGDKRKDNIVKRELFDKNVRGKYNISVVVDDRDRVVRSWRKELGLTCLQVNYGDF